MSKKNSKHASEQDLIDAVTASEKRLRGQLSQAIDSVYGFGESHQKRIAELERQNTAMRAQLASIEHRLIELGLTVEFPEAFRRIRRPPAPPA